MPSSYLIDSASTVFALITRVRHSPAAPPLGVEAFRAMLLRELEAFVRQAARHGADADTVSTAKYALSALIDESVLMTPWGQECGWSAMGLVLDFFHDANAGENFFLKLNGYAGNPGKNVELIELFYVCLTMGFRGKFELMPNGEQMLEGVRQKVFKLIEMQRGVPDGAIAAKWQGIPTPIRMPQYWLPFWWSSLICIVLAVILLTTFRISLSSYFDQDMKALSKLEVSAPAAVPLRPAAVTLRQLLKSDIEQGNIELVESPGKGLIRLRGDELFASGSSRINDSFRQVIERISQAVFTFGGSVTIAGHTDDRPLKGLLAQSNLELSRQRAQNVADIMVSRQPQSHILVIGRGDMEPLVDNSTIQNRAKNRRVEIRVDTIR